jgi:hypothetical protein
MSARICHIMDEIHMVIGSIFNPLVTLALLFPLPFSLSVLILFFIL